MVLLLRAAEPSAGGGVGKAGGGATSSAPATRPVVDPTTYISGLAPGSRILKTFDFEEKALGNYESLPMYFDKVAGQGYPLFTGGKFANDVFRSANTSFKLELDGGSVAYRLQPGRLPISPNADYYIIAFVKTTALAHARAEMTTWFADESGTLLRSTETHSERWASATGNDDWHMLQIYMPGVTAPAAGPAGGEGEGAAGGNRSLVIQLGLLQPQQLGSPLGKYELYRQDLKGAAWWDDIIVYQLPRLSIGTPVAGNIFGPGQRPTLTMVVSDLGRDQLTATLTVQDAQGQTVHRRVWAMDPSPEHPWAQQVALPALGPGWYQASLDVTDPKTLVVRRQTRFVTAASGGEDGALGPAREFGVVATSWPVESWPYLPTILAQAGVGLVKLPAWRKDMSEESLLRKDQPFEQLLQGLQKADIQTIGNFSEVPSVLTARLNEKTGDTIVALLDADASVWKPYVSFIMARYATRVNLWELGQESDAFYAGDARYPRLYDKAYKELAGLLSAPKLALPWNALYDFDPKVYPHAVLDLRIPSLIRPSQIPAYIKSFQYGSAPSAAASAATTAPATATSDVPTTEVLAFIEPLDNSYPRADRLTDFVQRVVLARSCNPRAILIDLPLSYQATLTGRNWQPEELLLVYRTLARLLGSPPEAEGAAGAGARSGRVVFKGEIALQPGVRAWLFDRSGLGVLVLWNEAAEKAEVNLSLPLGKAPVRVDYVGTLTPLEPANGLTSVTVGPAPVLLDHVDTSLLQLVGSFGLTDSIVPAGTGILQTNVVLRNPYPDALTGTLRLEPPAGWTIDPPSIKFSIAGQAGGAAGAAGGEAKYPVTLRYPYTEFAGAKTIKARLGTDQDAGGGGRPLELSAAVRVASPTVEIQCFPSVGPGGELILQEMITNVSSDTLNAQGYAMVPGLARQQRFVQDLRPNQTVIKRYTFPLPAGSRPGETWTSRKAAAVGLRQFDGTTLLTKLVPLE
jgi:hypothetical protein